MGATDTADNARRWYLRYLAALARRDMPRAWTAFAWARVYEADLIRTAMGGEDGGTEA